MGKFTPLKKLRPANPSERAMRAGIRIFTVLTISLLVVVPVCVFLWLSALGVFREDTSRFEALAQLPISDNSLVYDRDGKKIGEFFHRSQVYLKYNEIPETLVQAIISIEDRNFWEHPGVDPKAILRAAWITLWQKGFSQGASTITQQVVRHFLLNREKTLHRKVRELALAMKLEQHLSKERIFELYANVMFLGNGAYGVGAAALRHFGKPIHELNTAEHAIIAGLFQSPSAYNPDRNPERAIERGQAVLSAMRDADYLSNEEFARYSALPIKFQDYKSINQDTAPYFLDYVLTEAQKLLSQRKQVFGQGLRIHTTVDMKLQRLAQKTLDESKSLLDGAIGDQGWSPTQQTPSSVQAAILVTEPKTGHVLAMVGGRDYRSSQFNRTVSSLRSPGSAFKPVVYSLALERGYQWNNLLYIDPVTIDDYRPRNPHWDFLTESTLFRAFYRSVNTSTVELANRLGIETIISHAKQLGVESPLKNEIGTSLGGSEVTMMDMARMYGTLANYGRLVEPIVITRIEGRSGNILYQAPAPLQRGRQAVSPHIAFLTTEGLRAVLQRGTGFKSAHLADFAVGKTGTSNESRDNWFCGYQTELATIVWVGTDDNQALSVDAMGSTLALPIWDKFMMEAKALRPPGRFIPPPGVTRARFDPLYGNRVVRGGVPMYILGQAPPERPSPLATLKQKKRFRSVFE